MARAIIFHSNLPLKFWGKCVLIVAHIKNRLPAHLLNHKTPFEILMHKPPTYSHLKVFGYLAYASTLPSHRTKFDVRGRACVYIGYPFGVKGYKLFDIHTQKKNLFQGMLSSMNKFSLSILLPHPSLSSSSSDPTPYIPSIF